MSRARTTLILGLSAAVLVTASGCDFLGFGKSRATANSIAPDAGTVGIRNLSQLNLAMSAVTGVAPTTQVPGAGMDLNGQYALARPWLSVSGSAMDLNGSMLLAITGLAGSYCKLFIAQEAAISTASSRKAHSMVNFSQGVPGLTLSVAQDVATKYARLFWRRDPTTDELGMITDALNDAATAVTADNAALASSSQGAQNALIAPCTAVLSSLEFIKI